MLDACNISKRIGNKQIISGCSLQVRPGRLTVVLGPNGAGKSSLLKVISGEDKKFDGKVSINGRPVRQLHIRDLSRARAILPQQTIINFPYTVEQIVEIGRFSHRASVLENQRAIEEAMRMTGIEEFKGRMYHTLSGGEKQRVQMARVISQISSANSEPRYLLLDEPTSSLDLAQQHKLLSLARDLCHQNIGVLAVLHDLNLALHYADDIFLMREGKMIASGPLHETISAELIEETYGHPVRLIRHNGHPYVIPVTRGMDSMEIMPKNNNGSTNGKINHRSSKLSITQQ